MSAPRLSRKHPHRRWPGSTAPPSPPRRPERLHCWAGQHSGVRLPEQQARPNRCGYKGSSEESDKLPSRPCATGRSAGQHLSFSTCLEQGRGTAGGGGGASCPGLAGHPLYLLRPSPSGSGRTRGTERAELPRCTESARAEASSQSPRLIQAPLPSSASFPSLILDTQDPPCCPPTPPSPWGVLLGPLATPMQATHGSLLRPSRAAG